MKITSRRLSIPPYISCSWDQVSSLHVDEREEPFGERRDLIVYMHGGARVTIPHLSESLIDMIFSAHGDFLDSARSPHLEESATPTLQIEGQLPPGLIALSGGMIGGGIADIMQHNPAHKDMPDLSKEVLDRIIGMVKMIAPDELSHFSAPEPHCNCIHCQIARALQSDETQAAAAVNPDEEVSDEDLSFREWDVTCEGDNLYCVRNPLDPSEEYHVHLGDPLGCTCGSKKCEHIAAALKT